jgi:hypothetical protein
MQGHITVENDNTENEITITLGQLKQDIREYVTSTDMKTNIETHLFMKIKGSYKILLNDFINYTTDENNIPNYNFMGRIKEELNNINRVIDNYENVIKARSFEFRHRVSQLVAKLNTTNMSDSVLTLVRSVNIYDELTL